jgi:nucleoside-diphosphate-sugar epimerase
MRVLVTGAGGFAGSHVARALAALPNTHVVALARARSPESQSLHALGVCLYDWDLAEIGSLPGPAPEAVIHCAAAGPWCTPYEIAESNVTGMLCLADALSRWHPRIIIFFSSICVHGDISPILVEDGRFTFNENYPRINPDPYGASKYLGERILAELDIPTLALRLPGIIGLHASPRNWLPSLAHKLHANHAPKPVPIKANSLDAPFNNAVHIADLCALIQNALERSEYPRGLDAVTLAAVGQITVREAIKRLAAGLGQQVELSEVPPAKPPYLISSARAMSRWSYAPQEIGAMIDRYAAEVVNYEH